MKTLKVYDDVHTGVKVASAQSGRTTTNVASLLLREALKLVGTGRIKLSSLVETPGDLAGKGAAK